MKNILILSFLYNDPVYIRRFEILRDHYNKIIDHFGLPMKYYGVMVADTGYGRIDNERNIIYIDNKGEGYDKKLVYKVRDTYEFLHEVDFPYDVTIKTNASFLINLVYANRIIQKNSSDRVLCSQILKTYNLPWNLTARGNMMILSSDIIQKVLPHLSDEYIESVHKKHHIEYMSDDMFISSILCRLGHYMYEFSQKFTRRASIHAENVIHNPFDILNLIGVTIKSFYNKKDIYSDPMEDADEDKKIDYLRNMDTDDIDLIQTRWLVSILEHEYIH